MLLGQASSEEELYSWMVPLRVLVGSHNLVRTGAAGSMCYIDVARRVELVNMRNRSVYMGCGETARAKTVFYEAVLYLMFLALRSRPWWW